MRQKVRKGLILTAKILLSIALLAYVLRGVEWHDFVVAGDGKTKISVRSAQEQGGQLRLTLADGREEIRSPETLTPIGAKLAGTSAGSGELVKSYLHPGFRSSIDGIVWWLLVVGALCFLLSTLTIAFRWWRLVKVLGIRLSLWESTRLTFLGQFFNNIVLGTTGGDLVKAYYLSRHQAGKATSLVTVLVDRLIGLTGMTLLSALMLVIVFIDRNAFDPARQYDRQFSMASVVAGAVLAGLLGMGVFIFSGRLRRWLRLEKFYQRLPLAKQMAVAGEAITQYRRNLPALLRAMAETLVAQMLFIGGIALTGYSLHLQIPWYQYFIFIPLIYIIAAVPIVPGGVGLAESFYVTFFIAWATQSQIMALALLARLIPVFWGLPGAIVAVTGPKIPPASWANMDEESTDDTDLHRLHRLKKQTES